MANVDARATSWQIAEEASTKVAGSTWYKLEPNDWPSIGGEIGTVARRPISGDRQPRKGTQTSIDAPFAMEHDITHHLMGLVAEGFVWAEAFNDNLFFEAADTSTDHFLALFSTNPTASQATKLQFTAAAAGPVSILFAQGYANAANNGQHLVAEDATGATGTDLEVQSTLVTETAPANATVEIAGIRTEAGDLEITAKDSAGVITLTSGGGGGTALDFTTVLQPGMVFHVGGTAAANQLDNGAGYARAITVAAGTVTAQDLSGTLVVDTGGTKLVDLLYGQWWRPVLPTADADDTRYKKVSVTLEGTYPDLLPGPAAGYRYNEGGFGNTITFNVPLEDKATMSVGWSGLNFTTYVASGSRKAGASTPIEPLRTTAINTTSDIPVLNVFGLALPQDPCFQDLSLTIDNGLTVEKCLGAFGGDDVAPDLFTVSFDAEYLLAFPEIGDAIRNNTTASFGLVFKNENGVIALDSPAGTFGGGAQTFPESGTVRESITYTTHKDDTTGINFSISMMPVAP